MGQAAGHDGRIAPIERLMARGAQRSIDSLRKSGNRS